MRTVELVRVGRDYRNSRTGFEVTPTGIVSEGKTDRVRFEGRYGITGTLPLDEFLRTYVVKPEEDAETA